MLKCDWKRKPAQKTKNKDDTDSKREKTSKTEKTLFVENAHVCMTSIRCARVLFKKIHSRKARIEMMTTRCTHVHEEMRILTTNRETHGELLVAIWRLIRNLVASYNAHKHIANDNGMRLCIHRAMIDSKRSMVHGCAWAEYIETINNNSQRRIMKSGALETKCTPVKHTSRPD